MDKFNEYLGIATKKIIFFAPKVALAFIVLWVGLKIIKKIEKPLNSLLKKAGLSDSIRPFLISIINFLAYIIIFFVVAGIIGIDLSLFASIIAASVFAIGMSLQGSLSNFASGLLVLSLKPYKANDFIQVEDKFGKVTKIDVFSTIVTTPGNKSLIIPNSKMTEEIITNYSNEGCVRLDVEVHIPYHESFERVKPIIENALADIPQILAEPKMEIGITKFESHAVTISVWPYINPENYWETTFKVHENIKTAFAENDIEVAYSEGVQFGKIGK